MLPAYSPIKNGFIDIASKSMKVHEVDIPL